MNELRTKLEQNLGRGLLGLLLIGCLLLLVFALAFWAFQTALGGRRLLTEDVFG